jgi:hypothetical protein
MIAPSKNHLAVQLHHAEPWSWKTAVTLCGRPRRTQFKVIDSLFCALVRTVERIEPNIIPLFVDVCLHEDSLSTIKCHEACRALSSDAIETSEFVVASSSGKSASKAGRIIWSCGTAAIGRFNISNAKAAC